jgi:hypothetical protein
MSSKTSWAIRKTLNESVNTHGNNAYKSIGARENRNDAACADCFCSIVVRKM